MLVISTIDGNRSVGLSNTLGRYCHPSGSAVIAAVLALSLAACSSDSSEGFSPEPSDSVINNDGPEGDSELIIGNRRFPLDVALGDMRGSQDGIFQIDFTVSNGTFQFVTLQGDDGPFEVLVPAQATAVFFASMFSPGEQFDFGSFAFTGSDTSAALTLGTSFFSDSYVGLDENNNELIEVQERIEVIDGVVQFSGFLPDVELQFSLTLANGASVTGHYTGLFDFTER